MIKILLADQHEIFREGLKKYLNKAPDIRIAGEAEDNFGVWENITEKSFDIVVLDISMQGVDLIRQIKKRKPELPIMVLSMYDTEHYIKKILDAGASGYILKHRAPDELIQAIYKIVSRASR